MATHAYESPLPSDTIDVHFPQLQNFEKRLNKIKDGDMLNDIIFYTGWAMVRTKSVVRNVTRIREGKDKGQYFVEIESEDVV